MSLLAKSEKITIIVRKFVASNWVCQSKHEKKAGLNIRGARAFYSSYPQRRVSSLFGAKFSGFLPSQE
jgi:hypothetical protein